MKSAREKPYSDLDLDFIKHPTTGDVVLKTGEDAIKRSVRNLVLTNFYDRKFQSWIGGNVQKLLFELPTPLTEKFLKDAIYNVIGNFEPRVQLTQIAVKVTPDQNGFKVSLYYVILNTNQPIEQTLFLERIR
jgi:phage baseplate assembly protein W